MVLGGFLHRGILVFVVYEEVYFSNFKGFISGNPCGDQWLRRVRFHTCPLLCLCVSDLAMLIQVYVDGTVFVGRWRVARDLDVKGI